MIFIRLAGGLGNQLFQVMAGVLLGQRTKQPIAALTSGLNAYHTVRTPDVMRLLSSPNLLSEEQAMVGPVIRWLSVSGRAGRWAPLVGVNDMKFPHALDEAHRAGHINFIDGYFQRGWNAVMLAEAIAQVQVFDPHGALERANQYDCIVHVRGGDFMLFKSYAIVSVEFYERCLSLAYQRGCRTFGVVTDDPVYANHLIDHLCRRDPTLSLRLLPPEIDTLQDFATLLHARNRIIGNSTFAWWASALDAKKAPTLAPDRFIRDEKRDIVLTHELIVETGTL